MDTMKRCFGTSARRMAAVTGSFGRFMRMSMLGKDIKQLRRVFFERPPATEAVDFSRYIEDEHTFVERRFKARVDRMNKQLAQMEAREGRHVA